MVDRDLQKKWDKILAKSGFVDIEPLNGNGSRNTPFLKNHSTRFAKRYNPLTEEYYRLAGQFEYELEEGTFQRWVWSLHAEGKSLRQMTPWRVWKDSPIKGCAYIRSQKRPLPYSYLKQVMNELREQFKEWISEEVTRGNLAREEEDNDDSFDPFGAALNR